ncbi:MAG: TraB/GumN family protein [Spirochaetales bacterium]|nr:TraB/GumN family protein [Spirochaetales bacterium]
MTITHESDTETRIELKDGRKIILIGTAHISEESVTEVREKIASEKPDRVCIELDEARYKSITEGKKWSDMNIAKVLKERKGFLLLTNLVLSSFQKKLGLDLGTKPGDEMLAAITTCKELEIPFDLADRDITITLKRAWAKSNFWNKNKLLSALFASAFTKEKLSEEDIEELKKKNALSNMMEELAKELPSVKEVLIDERDRFLASKIYDAQGKTIMAVIGAGHAPGICEHLEKLSEEDSSSDISDINFIPKTGFVRKAMPWLVSTLVVGLFAYMGIARGVDQMLENMAWWAIFQAGFSFIGASLALAHPLSILAGTLSAPFVSLVPIIGAGLVAGLVESAVRKPNVGDFERLPNDALTFRGFYKNKVTRILLVFFYTNFASIIAKFILFKFLIDLLPKI